LRETQRHGDPSPEFVRLIAGKVHGGKLTQAVKDSFKALIVSSVSSLIRDRVNERLTSALTASNPVEEADPAVANEEATFTSEDEIAGFNIVKAIATKVGRPEARGLARCQVVLRNPPG